MHSPRHLDFGMAGCVGGVADLDTADRFQLVETAEALGFHAFWLNEEHFQETGRLCTSPLVVGAAFAARTRRLRIGTAVLLLPLHHPVQLAEDLATLDVLSDGRIDVGVSRGGQQRYYDGFGVDREERFDRFDEAMAILQAGWTGERQSFTGRFWSLPDVAIRPRTRQPGGPPLFVASYDIPSVEGFARAGLGVLEGGVQSSANIARKTAAYEAAWREAHGTAAPAIPTNRVVYVGETDEQAWADVTPYLERAFTGSKANPFVQGAGALFEDPRWEAFRSDIVIVGGPDTVRARLEQLHDEAGLRSVNCLVHFYWDTPTDLMLASMARLAAHVMPHFQPLPDPLRSPAAALAAAPVTT